VHPQPRIGDLSITRITITITTRRSLSAEPWRHYPSIATAQSAYGDVAQAFAAHNPSSVIRERLQRAETSKASWQRRGFLPAEGRANATDLQFATKRLSCRNIEATVRPW
jgi:hypothetical protein